MLSANVETSSGNCRAMPKDKTGFTGKLETDRGKGELKMDLVNVIRKVQRKKALQARSKNQAFCFLCQKQVSLLSFQQATRLDDARRFRIAEHLEENLIHRIHNSSGEISICLNSVEQAEMQAADTLPLSVEFLNRVEMA